MLIDVICIVCWVFAAWKGWSKGFFVSLVSFIGLIIGFILAMKFSGQVANYLRSQHAVSSAWLPFLAFILVMAASLLLLHLCAKLLTKLAEIALMGWLNKTGGVFIYVLLFTIWISGFLFFTERLSFFTPKTKDSSVLYPWVQPVAPAIMNRMSKWIPWLKETFPKIDQREGASPSVDSSQKRFNSDKYVTLATLKPTYSSDELRDQANR